MKEKVEQIEKNETNGTEEKKDDKLRKVIIVLLILLILSLLLLAGSYLYLKYRGGDDGNVSTVSGNRIEEGEVTENSRDTASQGGTSSTGETSGGLQDEKDDTEDAEEGDGKEDGEGDAEPEEPTDPGTDPVPEPPSSSGGHWVYTSDADLELYSTSTEVNAEFQVENMLPGDRERRFFCVKAYHRGDVTVYFEPDVISETKNLSQVLELKVKRLDAKPTDAKPVDGKEYAGTVLCDGTFRTLDRKAFPHIYTANAE